MDAHYYNNMHALLLRRWMCHLALNGVRICFISDNDTLAVGAPSPPQAAVTRQKRVVAGHGKRLEVDDHNCDSIAPSLKLIVLPPAHWCANATAAEPAAFYDGEVYVSSKDATLQASMPLHHAAETLQTLQLAGHDDSKGLMIRTDSGPDRNKFIAVQLAFCALAILLGPGVRCALLVGHLWFLSSPRLVERAGLNRQ